MAVGTTGSLGTDTEKFLAFSMSSERYGIDIGKVQEIIKVVHITRVPKSPDYIRGVINLRGKIIPVVDLRLRFGIPPIPYDDRTCIIVVELDRKGTRVPLGIVVDTVLEVMTLQRNAIEGAPNYGEGIESDAVIGIAKTEPAPTILVDIEKAFANTDLGS